MEPLGEKEKVPCKNALYTNLSLTTKSLPLLLLTKLEHCPCENSRCILHHVQFLSSYLKNVLCLYKAM